MVELNRYWAFESGNAPLAGKDLLIHEYIMAPNELIFSN